MYRDKREPMTWVLEPFELKWTALVGKARRQGAIDHNIESLYAADEGEEAWANDVMGAQAEYVVSQWLNLGWDPSVGKTNTIDVGGLFEVRLSRNPRAGLCIRPSDKKGVPHISVVGDGPRFRVRGWYLPELALARGNWKRLKKGTADIWLWFVPEESLFTEYADLFGMAARHFEERWATCS